MNNSTGFANNALNSRTIEADEIYTDNLTATTTTSTIQDFTDLTTDTINEKTANAGVTVDGVPLKDGLVDSVDVSALESDVDGFPDELKSLTADEINQLANIGTSTISTDQWGYLGATNQGLATTDSVTFDNISVNGTVDGVDVAGLKTDVDGFPDALKNLTTDEIGQLENIGSSTISATQWGYLGSLNQGLATTDSVTFAGLTTGGNLMMSAAQTSDSIPSNGKVYSRGIVIDSKGGASTYDGDEQYALSIRQDRNSAFGCGIYVRSAWRIATSSNILLQLENHNSEIFSVKGNGVTYFGGGNATISNSGNFSGVNLTSTGTTTLATTNATNLTVSGATSLAATTLTSSVAYIRGCRSCRSQRLTHWFCLRQCFSPLPSKICIPIQSLGILIQTNNPNPSRFVVPHSSTTKAFRFASPCTLAHCHLTWLKTLFLTFIPITIHITL